MFRFKTVAAVAATAALALLAPLAAGAKEAELQGPMALKGKGHFGAEVQMGTAEGQRPLKVSGRIGYVGFLDLGGDLKVRCSGKGKVQTKETEQGTVVLCAGRGGHAMAVGSHFKLRGFAARYRLLLPEGASGSFHGGRFVACVKGDEGWQCERPARADARTEQAEERKQKAEERKQKLEERKQKLEERKQKAQERRDKAQERKDGRAERKQDRKQEQDDDEEVPSLAELAALLAGK